MTSTQQANHLIDETSPYLLQHAHNPVNWYPWGEEAFRRARAENKPVFLSIGYAACHWCHVMERESFENEEVARILNGHFISIKVDREERPDLDELYMQAVQMMSGSGGWPMSVFLTPEGKPFYGGTYFPPEDRYGMLGFRRLLLEINRIYNEQPEKVRESSETLTGMIAENAHPAGDVRDLNLEMLSRATRELKARHDPTNGGFGEAPKFPPSMSLGLLLREWRRTGQGELLEMVERTLMKMAHGGVYDQLGGGFHRYSVDPYWLVPHFEKMLYDNALLAPVYFDAAVVTGQPLYLRVGREILDYVLREMTDPEGGFYSTQDADSEGVEGKYYVWRPDEILALLGPEDGALFCEYYDVSERGNWAEGRGASILNVRVPLEEFARAHGLNSEELGAKLDGLRRRLLELRAGRVAPLTDDKILTAWNGLMISALARGAQVTGDGRYAEAASRAAQFLLERMRGPEGGLMRTWRHGQAQARIHAFVEDYANLIIGLLDLYETTFELHLVHEADQLARRMLALFYDEAQGGFFTTDGRDATLVARIKEFQDGATPAGNSSAVLALERLGRLLDREEYLEPARRTLRLISSQIEQLPAAYHQMLCALSFELAPPKEVAIVGKFEAAETQALLQALWHAYLPNRVVALSPSDGSDWSMVEIAMLKNKPALGGRPTVYVCQNKTCREPVHTPGELRAQLGL